MEEKGIEGQGPDRAEDDTPAARPSPAEPPAIDGAADSPACTPRPAGPAVSIEVELARKVAFASHQCDVAVVLGLTVRNPTGRDLEGLTLEIAASPEVVAKRAWVIDRIPAGTEHHVRDRRTPLAGGMLAELTERMRADLEIRLVEGDRELAVERREIVALARNEWGGARHMPELLAAFVMPNDPAVARLLKDAAGFLEREGRRASLEGYQARSRTRCWEIVSAIWAAVTARKLTYAEPPASFEREGQKIRTPSDIENQGLATCLDTALLFAAAIEQAGMHPLIAITKGHAFCGAWLQPQGLASLTVEDPMEIRKALQLQELVLFETTLAANGTPVPFAMAIREAERQLDESNEEAFVYALDVRQARGRQIAPLPAIGEGAAGPGDAAGAASVVLPPLDPPPELPGFDFGLGDDRAPETPAERVEQWRRKLLDLTKTNRLLNLRPSRSAVQICCPRVAELEDLLAAGRQMKIVPMPEQKLGEGERDRTIYRQRTGDDFVERFAAEALERNEVVALAAAKDLDAGLIDLYRKAKAEFEEGGTNTLFLAVGMLRWRPVGETQRTYRAPLILLPVRLDRKSARAAPLLSKHDDDPVFNLTLLEMLRQELDIRIPALEGELPADESGIDVRRILETVRQKIRTTPGFEVVEEVVLSTFSFTKYLMWKDLSDRIDQLKNSPFVRHLVDTPREPYGNPASFLAPDEIDRAIEPVELVMPLNADSSQIVAVNASTRGGDFVLEGPPGTGKSETIGNIIAHNLAKGRRILFVSEKMAALDVVYRRLAEKGLGDFCLELHSNRANKKAVLDQLGIAWEQRTRLSPREWAQKAAELKQVRDGLNGLVEALHQPGPSGISPRRAIGRVLRYDAIHRLTLGWAGDLAADRAGSPERLSDLEGLAKRLGQRFGSLEPEDLDGFRGIGHQDWSYGWSDSLEDAARLFTLRAAALREALEDFSRRSGIAAPDDGLDGIAALAGLAAVVPRCAHTDLGFALGPDAKARIEALGSAAEAIEAYRAARPRLGAPCPDDRMAGAPVLAWRKAWERAQAERWPGRFFARRRSAAAVQAHFGLAKRPDLARDLDTLEAMVGQADRVRSLGECLHDVPGWRGLDGDPDQLRRLAGDGSEVRAALLALAGTGRDLAELRTLARKLLVDGRDLLEAGLPVAGAADRLVREHGAFEEALERLGQAADIRDRGDLACLERLASAILARKARLNAWCAWIEARREADGSGLGALVEALETGSVSPDATEAAFRTAYCRWLAPLLIDARPALKRFSTVAHEELIERFRALDRELTELASGYVRATLSGSVPGKDAKDAPPGYGVLARELQKKVRHKPVRQLVGEMGDALLTLTPCLMMSPLSVAQYLSPEQPLFDLVVFDEASQITVWDAIGAIARGRNTVIVGDPKQMPPTRFFEKGAVTGDDPDDLTDLESILDEALAARVPQHRLTGHYRSRHESLIAFSNHAYYDNKLVTYPAADTRQSAVSLRRVDGVYAKGAERTNPIEARSVVAEVVSRLVDPARHHLSIGVVTLNAEQQRLIEDLLDQERRRNPELEAFFSGGLDASGRRVEPVFVKNLETVQGDQRDVILLSVGYGPTEPGAKAISMNFGPLNRQGGERRLNVAITRATTEVVVFASFDAAMIDLARTSARAVHDLKSYLDFAERGPVALGEAIRSMGLHDYESDFEWAVADGLRSRGWDVRTQIGISRYRVDLGIVHPDRPGRFLAGIECDGATYHSSPSARDRDRVRQVVLENLGWTLVRIWSTDFFLDPPRALDAAHARLNALLEADRERDREAREESKTAAPDEPASLRSADCGAGIDLPAAGAPAMPSDGPEEPGPKPAAEGLAEEIAPFRAAPQALRGGTAPDPRPAAGADPSRFYEDAYLETLRALACRIVDEAGPITNKHLCDRVARLHGFQRTGREIRRVVWRAMAGARAHSPGPDGAHVFWPAGTEVVPWMAFRGLEVDGVTRDWSDLPYPEKLGLAREILAARPADPELAFGRRIGLSRLRQGTREQIAALLRDARETL